MLASTEKQLTISSDIQLPPGFRFYPSDEELIVHYLNNKATSSPLPASIIAEVDLYKYDPWELPKKAMFGKDEWYFFSPRERKYPNGARPNRATASGYWKATGTDKPILSSCGTKSVGVKKALVFYKGRPPKGIKTDWMMHEYRLLESTIWTPMRRGSMRLDDWVLCRVRQKNSIPRNTWEDPNRTSFEQTGCLTKANELWPLAANPNLEVVKNSLCIDCPMLPYIFASQDFSCMERDSSLSFPGSERSCISVSEDNSETKNLLCSVSSDSLLNPLKRKVMESNLCENSALVIRRKLTKGDPGKEQLVVSTGHDGSDVNLFRTDPSEGNNFGPDQWNSMMQYQELNELEFTKSE